MALGAPPGSRGHQVPGKDVGYMPQVRIVSLNTQVYHIVLAV